MRGSGGTNRAGFEVFALLAEAYGSGLPVGYLLVKSTDAPATGTKRQVLEEFLKHFRDRWGLNVKVTLSDKDWSEIGACQCIFPDAKHQLCFWHCLRAVKKRLAILRRQPGPYNVDQAIAEFSFIDPTFLPLAQQPASAPRIAAVGKPIPRITIRQAPSVAEETAAEPVATKTGDLEVEKRTLPRIVLKVFGRKVTILDPGRHTNATAKLKDPTERVESDTRDNDEADEGLSETHGDMDVDVDVEDMFFCPAQHRPPILHIFTKHFVRHPIFPSRLGNTETAAEIRARAVQEMYMHEEVATVGALGITTPLPLAYHDDGGKPLAPAQAAVLGIHPPTEARPCDPCDLYGDGAGLYGHFGKARGLVQARTRERLDTI